MEQVAVDLKKEQQATMARARYDYSAVARGFFRSMDAFAGVQATLSKAKLVEMLATIPYRAWEHRQYTRLTRGYADRELVDRARAIAGWAREAQDNEYRHLLVIHEKLSEDAARDPRYMTPPLPSLMTGSYAALARTMARLGSRRAYLLNAEFEDHAEHTYAELVDEHPEWEEQPVTSDLVMEYGSFGSWADVFRRIGLDERDHMNESFALAGTPEHIVHYEGMPAIRGGA